jgi:anti-sigma regulatory factor (Ser/Thr protein kinase)
MELAMSPLRVPETKKVPDARHQIREFATTMVGTSTAADVELMAAEAITNALLHGRGGAEVTITCTEKTLRVEVRDHGPGLLVARRVDHGRGLNIVDAFAARWGLVTDDTGTCLFFEVDRKADA